MSFLVLFVFAYAFLFFPISVIVTSACSCSEDLPSVVCPAGWRFSNYLDRAVEQLC